LAARRWTTRRGGEKGISTVEVVIALPLLVFMMLFMLYLGIKVNLIGSVQSAADDAARMGSAQGDSLTAQQQATNAANADMGKGTCVDVLGSYPQVTPSSTLTASGEYTVTVTCTKEVLGIDVTVKETGTSPVDTYRQAN
jgi:Flp pilus assembly protein TadG